LLKRAAVSGELVLSDFTKEALNQFKNKEKCYCSSSTKNKNCRKQKRDSSYSEGAIIDPFISSVVCRIGLLIYASAKKRDNG
jgi:hypothetical protein